MNKRKPPIIPTIRQGNTFVTNVGEKPSLFNYLLANQCTLINTSSSLQNFEFITNSSLDTVEFRFEDILLFIRNLNAKKAQDEISASMLKICDENIVPPLLIILKTALVSGTFPSSWKKANIVPIHKKQEKTLVKNYRPISLLPITGKFFEKCIYNCIYSYFETNALFSPCHSLILLSFDASPSIETRGIFLDIPKSFDKVWHEGLLFKLQTYGIKGPLLPLIKKFLSDRFQRVVLNGQTSDWKSILEGVPKVLYLDHYFFLFL